MYTLCLLATISKPMCLLRSLTDPSDPLMLLNEVKDAGCCAQFDYKTAIHARPRLGREPPTAVEQAGIASQNMMDP